MAVEHERHHAHEHPDQFNPAPARYDASGWGPILGIAAVLAILGMLFIGIGSSPDSPAPQPAVERTAPTPGPAPTTAPTPSAPAPATK